jgi:hypothetical protein
MNEHQRIRDLKVSKGKAQAEAQALLALSDIEWSEWEERFLRDLVHWRGPIATRQAEKLIELRDQVTLIKTVDGFSVPLLLKRCFEARADLSEESAAFIENLYARNPTSVRRRQAAWLTSCARKLHLLGSP